MTPSTAAMALAPNNNFCIATVSPVGRAWPLLIFALSLDVGFGREGRDAESPGECGTRLKRYAFGVPN
jgi:hypothetical protein